MTPNFGIGGFRKLWDDTNFEAALCSWKVSKIDSDNEFIVMMHTKGDDSLIYGADGEAVVHNDEGIAAVM